MSNLPNAYVKAQNEEAEFKAAISEGMLQKIGSIINKALTDGDIIPVGSIELSMLTETQFITQKVSEEWLSGESPDGGDASAQAWVLADGRDIRGSDPVGNPQWGSKLFLTYAMANAPDLRGTILRCKDHGAGIDTAGDLPLGTYEKTQMITHGHTVSVSVTNVPPYRLLRPDNSKFAHISPANEQAPDQSANTAFTVSSFGTGDNRPRNITVNIFIKIN